MDEVGHLVSRRLLGRLLVGRFVHQVGRQLARQLELEDPAFAVRVGVDELRLGGQLLVHRRDAPAYGRERSLAALTDSTTPKLSRAANLRPAAGSSRNTTSPNCDCA